MPSFQARRAAWFPPGRGRGAYRGGQYRNDGSASKFQRLRLSDVRQRLHLLQHLVGNGAVDLDQCDGIAALRLPAEMERRDIDAGVAQQAGEAADEARPEIGRASCGE